MKKIMTMFMFLVLFFQGCLSFAGTPYSAIGGSRFEDLSKAAVLRDAPDLRILSISVNKQNPVVGQQLDIAITVKNSSGHRLPIIHPGNGTGHTTSASSKYITIQGTASNPTQLNVKIGNRPTLSFQVPRLNPNQKITFRTSFTPSQPGLLHITATVDPSNIVKEGDENDNTRYRTIRIASLPDFKVTRFFVTPCSVRATDRMTIHAVIQNNGGSGAATIMRFDIFGDISGSQDVILHPVVNVPFLAPGKNIEVTYSFTPPKAGRYTFGGVVNNPQRTPESNTQNNSVPNNVRICVKPAGVDLAVVSITADHRTRRLGQPFRVHVTIKNLGNRPSGAFNVFFHRPQDLLPVLAQDHLDIKWACPSLAPSQTLSKTFTFKYKKFARPFTARVEIDPERVVNDLNRANNEKSIRLKVKNPVVDKFHKLVDMF